MTGAAAFFAAAFFAGVFLAAVFFAVVFLAAFFLVAGPAGAAVGQQLGRALDGDRLDVVALAQAGVGLAVGDVGAEPALADGHRALGHRVVAELLERLGRGAAAPLLGLGEDRQRLVEGDA